MTPILSTIKARLSALLVLLNLLLILLGGWSLYSLEQASTKLEDMYSAKLLNIESLGRMLEINSSARFPILLGAIERDESKTQRIVDSIIPLRNEVIELWTRYQAMPKSPQEQALLGELEKTRSVFLERMDKAVQAFLANDFDRTLTLLSGPVDSAFLAQREVFRHLFQLQSASALEAYQASLESKRTAMRATLLTVLASMLICLGAGFWLIRSISGPLGAAGQLAKNISAGNLDQETTVGATGELGVLLKVLGGMQNTLRSAIQRIAQASTQLNGAVTELGGLTEDGARQLNAQNAELQQAATAVNQMSASAEQVARHAQDTAGATQSLQTAARQGHERALASVAAIGRMCGDLSDMQNLMEGLSGQVEGIHKVLDVIRGIAEQTNLLALNAAIEAARAGDSGRGFAVVADEVRALALRTQSSTVEIERMIEGVSSETQRALSSVKQANAQAEDSRSTCESAQRALEDIGTSVAQINQRNQEIASAADEQAHVTREIDRSLLNIRGLAEDSATNADSISQANHRLALLQGDLRELVSQFRT
ncbi:methyl-accepting chemotaxis protein [Pseudomonas sp. Z18(2022)]|uniref:methyl-accepting chemotaxis protein n=1 Tax=Pseudomonas sp. Z18(2022) TaxID=2983410 RepID=UPI002E8032D4|nr:methyl-accepting chemotaxis protein [Pseudomonas sp. Z18(2022)]